MERSGLGFGVSLIPNSSVFWNFHFQHCGFITFEPHISYKLSSFSNSKKNVKSHLAQVHLFFLSYFSFFKLSILAVKFHVVNSFFFFSFIFVIFASYVGIPILISPILMKLIWWRVCPVFEKLVKLIWSCKNVSNFAVCISNSFD